MKKILVLLIALFALALTSCMEAEDYYVKSDIDSMLAETYSQEEVDALLAEQAQEYESKNRLLSDEIEALQPSQADRFISYWLEGSFELHFIELNTEYTETVEAYGYSRAYVYEVNEPATLEIAIYVDNDLEFTWYSDYASNDDVGTTVNVTPSLFGGSRIYTIEANNDYVVIEFESWDEYADSTVSFMLTVFEGE